MGDINIFCCNNKVSCASYKESQHICFHFFYTSAGKVYEYKNRRGFTWFFVLSGSIELEVEGRYLLVESKQMSLFVAENYKVKCVEEGEVVCFTSSHPTEYCTHLLSGLQEKEENEGLERLPVADSIHDLLKLVKVYLSSGIRCDYLFEQKQQELFMLMAVCYSKEVLGSFFYCLSLCKEENVKKVILDNCLKAKNVQELAMLCGYSLGGFKRIFKEIFNEPVYRWMLQQKAAYLKERLLEKDVNLKFLIDELGFSSPAHFTKFCKQWLGMVPTKFMKSRQDNLDC